MSHTTVNSQERVFQFNLCIILFSTSNYFIHEIIHINKYATYLLYFCYNPQRVVSHESVNLHEPLLFLISLVTNCNKKVVNFAVILAFFIPIMITTAIYDWSRTWIRINLFSVSGSQLSAINYSISYPFSFSNFNEEIRTLTLFSLVHHNSRMKSGSQEL